MAEQNLRILVCVNALTAVNQYVYANHSQLWFRLGREWPNAQFFFFSPPRMSIDRARNTAAKVAMEQQCDYLWFIDDDVLVPITALKSLVEADYDIIAGVVVVRGYPYNAMFFKFDETKNLVYYNDYLEKSDPLKKVIDVDAVGFSCALIKVDLLKKINPPYFVTGPNNTEDIYFCMKALDVLGREKLNVGVHREVVCGHVGDARIFLPANIEYHKALDEFENPAIVEMDNTKEAKELRERSTDRGERYLERIGIAEQLYERS